MKTEQIKKFRIIDKDYLPMNVVAIEVEDNGDCVIITYIYDRDGQTRVERFSLEQLKLFYNIYVELKYND